MAFEKGTATGYSDLLNKLIAFLTTNPDLVAADQQYSVYFDATGPFTGQTVTQPNRRHVVLKSRGLSGNDEIYTSISEASDTSNDYYNWAINGGTGFVASSLATNYSDMRMGLISPSQSNLYMLLWNQPMTYWFFANGRRWFVVAKVSAQYEAGGAGFILPPCPPSEYPFPLALWGSSVSGTLRWSDTSTNHIGMTNGRPRLRLPGGAWDAFKGSSYATTDNTGCILLPTGIAAYVEDISSTTETGPNTLAMLRDNPDGSFPLIPFTFASYGIRSLDTSGNNIYGEAEGLFWIPSLNNGSEDEIVIDGVTHYVFQSVNRSGNPYLFALRA